MEGFFQDPHTFTLSMTVRLQPSSGFLIYFWTSPSVILATHTGHGGELYEPDWVEMLSSGPLVFRQPRSHVIEVFMVLAKSEQNSRVAQQIARWCTAVSVSHIFFIIKSALISITEIVISRFHLPCCKAGTN